MTVQKGGQVTKPIIVVKIPCKLAIVCYSSKRILNKMFNFLALLDITVHSFWSLITIVASDWPHTFFTARLFLSSILFTKTSVLVV